MDRRLGRPLPHQLPNPTRADPLPINLSPVGLMRYYSQFPRAIPQQRARSHALLTRPPLEPKSSLDLHVLGLPPAFVLSQDQTLKLKAHRCAILDRRTLHICPLQKKRIISACRSTRVNRQTVKLTLSSSVTLESRYANFLAEKTTRPPAYPFRYLAMSKSTKKQNNPNRAKYN